MEGGPKSLKAGLKLDDEGRDGDGTEEPGQRGKEMQQCDGAATLKSQPLWKVLLPLEALMQSQSGVSNNSLKVSSHTYAEDISCWGGKFGIT